jgi:hypothetical protein
VAEHAPPKRFAKARGRDEVKTKNQKQKVPMKNKTLAIRMAAPAVGIMVMAGICAGQTLHWQKTYGGPNNDAAHAITAVEGGNFIVAGQTFSIGAGGYDIYLLKIKPDGDTMWTTAIGGPDDEDALGITATWDGGYIVTGSLYSSAAEGSIVYLMKIDSNGKPLWTKKYGSPKFGFGGAITPTPEGNFIVAGCTAPNSESVYLLKIKPDGDTIWTKTYGDVSDCRAYAISPAQDGTFIVAGTISNLPYILKINSIGDTLWTRTYTEGSKKSQGVISSAAFSITPTDEGNFVIEVTTAFFDTNGHFDHALKGLINITTDGDTLWTSTTGETDNQIPPAVLVTKDGYMLSATTVETLENGTDISISCAIADRYAYKNTPFRFKIPVTGESLNYGYTPLKVPSGMTVSLGGTISWTPTTDSVYMDHVEFQVSDDFGKKDTLTFNIFVNSKDHPSKVINPTSNLKNQAHRSSISISTFSSYTSFSLPVPTGSLAIYDIHGRLIETLSVSNSTAIWNTKKAAGRYIARMMNGKSNVSKAFVVVK